MGSKLFHFCLGDARPEGSELLDRFNVTLLEARLINSQLSKTGRQLLNIPFGVRVRLGSENRH